MDSYAGGLTMKKQFMDKKLFAVLLIAFFTSVSLGCKASNQKKNTAKQQGVQHSSQVSKQTGRAAKSASTSSDIIVASNASSVSPRSVSSSFKSSPYKPSALWMSMDFEKEKIKTLKNKKGSYDMLELSLADGKKSETGIMYEGGTKANRYARISIDPEDKNNHVFHYWLKDAKVAGMFKGKQKGRIQLNFAKINKTSIFQRFRLYLDPDLAAYKQYPKQNGWFTINEFWMGAKWEKHPYPFRMSINIGKRAGAGKPLYFLVTGAIADGGKAKHGKWKDIWGEIGSRFEVPVGEWLDIELGYKQGNEKSGRFYMAVKREKDKKFTTVFDITNWTYHPDSPKPVPLTHWQPIKIYTSSSVIDFVRRKGGAVQLYWDDVEIYNRW